MDFDVSSDTTAVAIRSKAVLPIATFVAVVLIARVSVLWEGPIGSGQPLWLGSGLVIGVALVERTGRRAVAVLSGLAAIGFDRAVFVHDDIGSVVGDVAVASIEMVGGVVIFGLLFRNRSGLGRSGTTLVAFLLCFALPLLAGLVAVQWHQPVERFEFLWSWTLGNGMGMAAAGSLLLLLRGPGNWLLGADPGRNVAEFGVAVSATVGLVIWAFASSGESSYLVMAGLMWLAVRFGPRVGIPAALATVVYATIRSSAGGGPFGEPLAGDLLQLHAFNAAVIFSTSLVGRYSRGIDRERRRNYAVLDALPDVVTVSSGTGRVEQLVSTSAAEDELATSVIRELETSPPEPEVGQTTVRRFSVDVHDAIARIEARSLRIDRQNVLTLSRDISEPVRLVEDLRAAQDRWQRLATTAYEGFLEVDAETRVIFATPRMAEMLATEVDELIGARFDQLLDRADYERLAHQAEAVLRGERVLFETDFSRRDGQRAWTIVSGEPLLGDRGEFRGAIMFAADTTGYHEEHLGRALAEVRLASAEQLERQRIARGLHDGPLQSLVALSYQLHALTKGASIEDNALRLEGLAIESVRQMRDALEDLVPSEIPQDDLRHSLERIAARFEGNGSTSVSVSVSADGAMGPGIATSLYLIAREAIINAILHADARSIDVEIEEDTHGYALRVVDDGRGLRPDWSERRSGHLGLRAMRERAADFGGTLSIVANVPSGTSVNVYLPRSSAPAPHADGRLS